MLTGLVLFLAAATALDLGGAEPGTPIVSIRVVRHDVFDLDDPQTSSWPYRAANALHVLSRESFIRSVLLFHEGEPLNPSRLLESERLLRSTGFLNPVEISARPVEGGAEVLVETWDQWTTEVSLNFAMLGGRRKNGFAISEPNFAGLGTKVELELRSDAERDSITFAYADPFFFGTHWRFRGAYSDASDGSTQSFGIEYPFYALATPRAAGFGWSRQGLREWLWSDAEKAVSGRVHRRDLRLWAGIRLPGNEGVTNRLTVGLFAERRRFADWRWRADESPYPQPEDRDMRGLEIGWEHQVDRWEVVSGFRAWQKQEDLPLGPNWVARVGLSQPAFGGDRSRLRYDGQVEIGHLRGIHYNWLRAGVSGRLERNNLVDAITRLEVGRAQTGDSGWRARLAVDLGTRLDGDRQLTLGADTGLRGWSPDTFDGTSRAVLNAEWRRRLTGEVLHLGVFGVTAFADAGTSWNARVGRSTGGVRGDVGVGLLLEITRAASLHVVRLEVAMPDDGSGPVVLATSGSLF